MRLGKLREDPHAARPQAVGGLQADRGRFTAANHHFPDMIVAVVELGQAGICCQD